MTMNQKMPLFHAMRILFIISAVVLPDNSVAQVFPAIWPTTDYDYQHGNNGRLFVINSDRTNADKAYIFAANVPETDIIKDLMRLTCDGVTTLNSPKSGYDVQLHFCTQGSRSGEISASQNALRVHGTTKLELGNIYNYSILELTTDRVVSATDFYVDYDAISLRMGLDDSRRIGWIGTTTNDRLALGAGMKNIITLDGERPVAYVDMSVTEIDKVKPELKNRLSLFVKKGIVSEDYVIAPSSTWSDDVFNSDYRLNTLEEVNSFISKNGHLPDVPSSDDVADNGYSQHEMNKILLKKIEELTLYLIEQDKIIQELISKLESR